jgi:hypothetical protein
VYATFKAEFAEELLELVPPAEQAVSATDATAPTAISQRSLLSCANARRWAVISSSLSRSSFRYPENIFSDTRKVEEVWYTVKTYLAWRLVALSGRADVRLILIFQ